MTASTAGSDRNGVPLPDELVQLLSGTALCYLSTVMPDGSPQVTQTWVDTDGHDVLINTVVGHQKEKNIRRDPRVAVALSSVANPSRYFEVRGRVTQATTDGAAEHIDALAQRYLGGPYPRYGGPDEVRVLLRISPAKVNVMG